MVIIAKLVAFFLFSDALVELDAEFEGLTQISMGGPKVWIKLQGLLKLGYCFGIATSDNVAVPQVRVDDHRKRIKIDRTPQLSYCALKFTERRENGIAKGIVRERVIGILGDRLVEVVDCFREILRSAFPDEVTAS